MIIRRIWDEIESPHLAASLGVVSTPRAFDAAILQHPIVVQLMAHLSSRSDVEEVAHRLGQLLTEATDVRYCHQHDLAIAIYLRTLDICAPNQTMPAALLALKQPNLWWARAMAMRIVSAPNRGIPSSRGDFTVPIGGRVFIVSENAQATPFLPTAQFTVRPRVSGVFASHTDAGRETQEFSLSPQRIGFRSSVDAT